MAPVNARAPDLCGDDESPELDDLAGLRRRAVSPLRSGSRLLLLAVVAARGAGPPVSLLGESRAGMPPAEAGARARDHGTGALRGLQSAKGEPMKCRGTLRERFLTMVEPEPMSGCWFWMGAVSRRGYGTMSVKTERPGRYGWRTRFAHQVAWDLFRGNMPDGLEPDHVCRVRSCVNPAHLEAVTHQENLRRAVRWHPSHCPSGHAYSPENTRPNVNGGRCRTCHREDGRRRWRERRAV
jgi:hypothetical protein